MNVLIEAKFPGGSVGCIVPDRDLTFMSWHELLAPLAGLLAIAQPEAEWTARPLEEDETEKSALLGY